MTLNQIWSQLCGKNRDLKNDDAVVEFKSKNLKALLKQVYEKGRKSATHKEDIGFDIFDRFTKGGRR